MAKLAGIVDLKINGEKQKVKGTVDWTMGGKEREFMDGNDVHGFTSKIVASELTLKVVFASDTSMVSFVDLEGATIIVETDVGVTLVMAQAATKASPSASIGGGDNEVTIVFGGNAIEEL